MLLRAEKCKYVCGKYAACKRKRMKKEEDEKGRG